MVGVARLVVAIEDNAKHLVATGAMISERASIHTFVVERTFLTALHDIVDTLRLQRFARLNVQVFPPLQMI